MEANSFNNEMSFFIDFCFFARINLGGALVKTLAFSLIFKLDFQHIATIENNYIECNSQKVSFCFKAMRNFLQSSYQFYQLF